jgi:long-chain acyl-CoA synthetase
VSTVAAFLAADAAGDLVALATSGSSGMPRAVVRTTGSWTSSFPVVEGLTALTPTSRVWVPGPLSATMNLFAAVHATVVGARLVEDPAAATHAHLTPTALRQALDRGVPLAGRTVVVAGDRLSPTLHDRATAAGARVLHYYGAAELSFVAFGAHAQGLRPFPGVEVSVLDGEIWVRSPYVCCGYVGRVGPLRTAAGGLATVGDRGELVDGRLRVAGRPGAVSVGGSTVEPADVEATLRAHARGEVVVVGVPHGGLGEVLAAVLTDADDHRVLREIARSGLDGAERPRVWLHVHPLPVTPAGKTDRPALVALVSRGDRRVRRLV